MDNDTPAIDDLLRQARAGDRAAVQRLLERYRDFVRLLVRSRGRGQLKARLDSSDIVQETLLRVAQNLPQFEGEHEEEWRAWLGRIAEREVIHQVRHHLGAAKRAVSREQPLGRAGDRSSITGSARLDQWLLKTQSSPSLVAMRKERALLLSDVLARLPDDYREVLILRHLEGLDFPEVAARMSRSAGAVRVLWTRALKKLRAELAQNPQLNSQYPHG
jgi:RNA polymerase sigma-70 factor (ECF subfamily)